MAVRVLRALARQGRTVVLIGHKLDEILRVADRVTVLRQGRTVLAAPRGDVDASGLARAMIGRAARPPAEAVRAEAGARVAWLEGVGARVAGGKAGDAPGAGGRMAVRDVTLEVRRGEIVGIGGVEGNGQRELALVLAGRLAPETGRVRLPATVSLIPQDRAAGGLVPGFDLAENTALAFHDDDGHRRGPFIDWRAMRRTAQEIVTGFDVRAPGWRATARSLSGGNQQKLLVGRELARSPDLLVAENPMRGLDIAAAAFLREKLLRLKSRGAGSGGDPPGIVFLSTDLDEVLDLADRVFVLVRGRLITVPDGERTPVGMGGLMLGSEGPVDAAAGDGK